MTGRVLFTDPRTPPHNTDVMAATGAVRDDTDQTTMASGSHLGNGLAWIVLAAVSVVWIRITVDAWRLRSLVSGYTETHGGYELGPQPWPTHLRALHQELLDVGADYFYPFAWGVILAVGLAWTGVAAIATPKHGRWRWGMIVAGASVLVLQLVLFAPSLADYITVTE